jgi:hypothetical protein
MLSSPLAYRLALSAPRHGKGHLSCGYLIFGGNHISRPTASPGYKGIWFHVKNTPHKYHLLLPIKNSPFRPRNRAGGGVKGTVA